MADYTIRSASEKDIDAIIDLCEAHAKFEGAEYDRTRKSARLASFIFGPDAPIKCIVVETSDGVLGYATYTREFSTWDAGYYMHMDCLYLDAQLRGKGIGRKMVEMIFSEAAAGGCVNLQWQTPVDNEDAIRFYERLGAIPKKKIRFFLPCEWPVE